MTQSETLGDAKFLILWTEPQGVTIHWKAVEQYFTHTAKKKLFLFIKHTQLRSKIIVSKCGKGFVLSLNKPGITSANRVTMVTTFLKTNVLSL